jgi:uncharacterized protein YkwD
MVKRTRRTRRRRGPERFEPIHWRAPDHGASPGFVVTGRIGTDDEPASWDDGDKFVAQIESDDVSDLEFSPPPVRRRGGRPLLLSVVGVLVLVGLSTEGVAIAHRWDTDWTVDALTVSSRHDALTDMPTVVPTSTDPTSTPTTEPAVEAPSETVSAPPAAGPPANTVAPQTSPVAQPSVTTAPEPALPAPAPSEPAPAPALAPAPAPQPGPAGLAGDILTAMNSDRAANGLGPLGWHTGLASYAQSWATWMAQNSTLAHQNLSSLLSLGFSTVGENVGMGPSGMTVADFEAMWMGSGEHRANILNLAFTAAGVGTAISADGHIWVAVDFGG